MPYGSPSQASIDAAVPMPQITQLPGGSDSATAQHTRASHTAIWIWLAFGLLYVAYAFAAKHQKLQESIKPSNIAANFHNLLVIFFGAVFSIGLFKIAAAKWQASKLPGGKTMAKVAGLI